MMGASSKVVLSEEQSVDEYDELTLHASVWARMKPMFENKQWPQACLFVGPPHAQILPFVNRFMARVFCEVSYDDPCRHCQSCHLLRHGHHPDSQRIQPDSVSGSIKIEQIRLLQQDVYQTPQCGLHRFILINPVDRLNTASANALLKILEEPPPHTIFLLIAEHLGNLPLTVISRCQQYVFPTPESVSFGGLSDYLAIGAFYPKASVRAQLYEQRESIRQDLCRLCSGELSACALAAQWSAYDLGDVLWVLYLITAQAIRDHLLGALKTTDWSNSITPVILFQQLDRINGFMDKGQKNIMLSKTLTIEVVLLGYVFSDQHSLF